MKQKELRSRNFTIRMSPEEYVVLQDKFRATTHRVFTNYLRDLIHQQPITSKYRNQSLDEFIPVALAMKNELETIGQHFTEAVKQLQNLASADDLRDSIEYFAAEEFSLRQKTEEIKNCLAKIYELWSQK